MEDKHIPTSKELQIGKAGEYLVCADLIINGYVAYPSEQGLPYDVVLDVNGKLLRVQVKTTQKYKNIPQRKTDIPVYIFNIGRNGRNNKHKTYKQNTVDLFALVSLDTRRIAYVPFLDHKSTMNFRVPELRGNYHDEQGEPIKNKVIELRNSGKNCSEISDELGMTLSNVYKYSANISIKQKGTNAGVYFDEFPLSKCLSLINL